MRRVGFFTALVILLASCATEESGRVVYRGEEIGAQPEQAVEQSAPEPASDAVVAQRILADMLYAARLAYEDNRLTSPPGDNAYDGYQAVLDFDPENEIALQGMEDIVSRYVQLADSAISTGQFDNAEEMLNRGRRIRAGSPEVAAAFERLEQARQIKRDVFTLDPQQLSERGLDIMVQLGEIGEYIRSREAVFLINARTDEEGRWIYKIMREAVGGYRLRGDIAVDAEPSIQVTVPRS